MIKKAKYLSGHKLKIEFEDGKVVTIDFEKFVFKSEHPLMNKFQDIELFKKFRIDDGVLCWGDNEMDFNPADLYTGKDPEPFVVTEEMKQFAKEFKQANK